MYGHRALSLWKCEIWSNGSRYSNRYIVWAHKFISSKNFLPVFSQYERQHFVKMHFYELLDGFKIKCIGIYCTYCTDCSNADCDENMSLAEVEWLDLNICYLKDEAWVELKEIYKKLRAKKIKITKRVSLSFQVAGNNWTIVNELVCSRQLVTSM